MIVMCMLLMMMMVWMVTTMLVMMSSRANHGGDMDKSDRVQLGSHDDDDNDIVDYDDDNDDDDEDDEEEDDDDDGDDGDDDVVGAADDDDDCDDIVTHMCEVCAYDTLRLKTVPTETPRRCTVRRLGDAQRVHWFRGQMGWSTPEHMHEYKQTKFWEAKWGGPKSS